MSLLAEELTLWEIGFRWAGLDPDHTWLLVPMLVKDHFQEFRGHPLVGRCQASKHPHGGVSRQYNL